MSSKQTGLDRWRYQELTEAELEVYRKVERHGRGPREIARRTGRSPGTVGNLLRRAREKVGEVEA